MSILETYKNEKMIEEYRNEERCAICGFERYVHKYNTHECPDSDPFCPYKPPKERKWRDTTFEFKGE